MDWVSELVKSLKVEKEQSVAATKQIVLGKISTKIIFEKNVIVFGDTGAGKSNLVNYLYGKNIFDSYSSAQSVTTKCQKFTMKVSYPDVEYLLHLHDTVGFDDTTKTDSKVANHIFRYLADNCKMVNLVILVVKFGKMTVEWSKHFSKNLNRINKWSQDSLLILVTHCSKLDQIQSFWSALNENDILKEKIFNHNLTDKNFVFVDLNPSVTNYCSIDVTENLILRILNSKETHTTGVFPGIQSSNNTK